MAQAPLGRPTMVDVAADAGVSLKTVSRVVNGVATVDPALAERVLVSIRRLGFSRNDVAASLRSGTETKTIGLLAADLSNTFYTRLLSSIATVARERGFHVMMASSEENVDLERSTALDLCQRRVSGLIVVPTMSDHSYLQPEVNRGIPVVFVDRPATGLEVDTVVVDNRGGAASATAELLSKGHRRIAVLLDSPAIYTMRERLDGVRSACVAAGNSLDESLVSHAIHTPDDAATVLGSMLESTDPPTAVLCGNNRSTLGAVEEVWRRGADIEIVGFDDFEFSRMLPRAVTIVDYDTVALGAAAAERLFARIDGDRSEPQLVRLPTRLVRRGGTWPSAS